MVLKILPRLSDEEEIRNTERREEELERLVVRYVRGNIEHSMFITKLKEINARFDLRRAGERLGAPSS